VGKPENASSTTSGARSDAERCAPVEDRGYDAARRSYKYVISDGRRSGSDDHFRRARWR